MKSYITTSLNVDKMETAREFCTTAFGLSIRLENYSSPGKYIISILRTNNKNYTRYTTRYDGNIVFFSSTVVLRTYHTFAVGSQERPL